LDQIVGKFETRPNTSSVRKSAKPDVRMVGML